MALVHNPAADPRPASRDWRLVLPASLLIVALLSFPYWQAYRVPPDHVFTGLLVNPVDGNTYFAKMRQGWAGNWLFTLPYTADPGPGVLIYTWYLFLGHVARWTGLSLDLAYALARAAGALALLLSAYAVLGWFLPSGRARLGAWLLFALGSGLGWLAVPFGGFPPDLWVAEAFPFLAMYSNAHFALGTALLLWIVGWATPGLAPAAPRPAHLALLAVLTTALAQVQPLGLLNAGLVIGGVAAWHAVTRRTLRPLFAAPVVVFGLSALPWLVYDLALTFWHPVLAAWDAQNLTPSPPLWEALLAGGLPLALAGLGLAHAARRRAPTDIVLMVWLVLNGLALYAPIGLQRRLSMGLWFPIGALAIMGLGQVLLPRLKPAWRPLLAIVLALLVLPSNLLVYGATLGAIAARDPVIFWTAGEAEALSWLAENAAPGDRVAAAPDMALYIPARTGARVIYGHPFETASAETMRQAVEDYYAGRIPAASFVDQHGLSYVFYGPRERALAPGGPPGQWPVVFRASGVEIYAP
jgi:hypothetical protein